MKGLVLFGILALILLSGCAEKEPLCKTPYFEYKTGECCLDKDSNQICDKDETNKEPDKQTTEFKDGTKEAIVKTSQEEFIKNLMNSVVTIETDYGGGSGFFIDKEGYVITNHHVIQGYEDGEKNVTVKSYDSGHSSNYKAKVIGYDYAHDIAVLKVDSKRDWKYFNFADIIKVGDIVYALGSPLEFDFSVSKGIISAKNREGINDKNVKDYLQTDAPINPGNSGGPLANEDGKVVGVNTWKRGFAEGLGFALESNKISEVYNNIRYIEGIYGIPKLNKISQEDFNEKIKIFVPEFRILWDKQ
ncbi:MAG: trypsin-like peptidase domain-containing protein, partial [Nanoarchaeota archaeon]|nr:trypsin-like peptidase domain-containing protein [Nanoarchaeota archaeon]